MSLNAVTHPYITVYVLTFPNASSAISSVLDDLTCHQYVLKGSLVSASWWISADHDASWSSEGFPGDLQLVAVCLFVCLCVCVCTICGTVSWIDPVIRIQHLTSWADTFTVSCVVFDVTVWSKGFRSHNMVSFTGKRCNTFFPIIGALFVSLVLCVWSQCWNVVCYFAATLLLLLLLWFVGIFSKRVDLYKSN